MLHVCKPARTEKEYTTINKESCLHSVHPNRIFFKQNELFQWSEMVPENNAVSVVKVKWTWACALEVAVSRYDICWIGLVFLISREMLKTGYRVTDQQWVMSQHTPFVLELDRNMARDEVLWMIVPREPRRQFSKVADATANCKTVDCPAALILVKRTMEAKTTLWYLSRTLVWLVGWLTAPLVTSTVTHDRHPTSPPPFREKDATRVA